MALVEGLGQVLHEVAQALTSLLGVAQDALDVDLRAEPDDVRRRGGRVGGELVERGVPGAQGPAGIGVDVAGLVEGLVPDRHPVGRVDGLVVGGPPHLVVGGGGDLAQELARDGAAYSGVQVRCAAALWFDGGEVLDVPADRAAEVLPEPVDQVPEVDRVAGGGAVVVALGVDG